MFREVDKKYNSGSKLGKFHWTLLFSLRGEGLPFCNVVCSGAVVRAKEAEGRIVFWGILPCSLKETDRRFRAA
jgi:hypothetical protein